MVEREDFGTLSMSAMNRHGEDNERYETQGGSVIKRKTVEDIIRYSVDTDEPNSPFDDAQSK